MTSIARLGLSSLEVRRLVACIATVSLADTAIWLRPAVTYGVGEGKGLSEQAAGSIMTVEILALSLTMLLCARFAGKIGFRTLALIGFGIALAASALSIAVNGIAALMIVRALAAAGFGILAAVPFAAVGHLPNPPQAYGFLFTGGTIIAFLALAAVPLIQPLFPHDFPFITSIVHALLMLPFVFLLPADDGFTVEANADDSKKAAGRLRWRRIVMISVAFSIQTISFQGIWAFFYSMASTVGLTTTQTSALMSATTLASIAGSLGSASMAKLVGRNTFILSSITLATAILLVLLYSTNVVVFSVAGCGLMLVLFSFYPAIFGLAADIDPSGRGASFLQGSGMMVGASGPFLVGALLTSGHYTLLTIGILTLGALALVLFVSVLRSLGPAGTQSTEPQG